MEEKLIKKIFGITLFVYFISIVLIYLVSNKQFHYGNVSTDMVSQTQVVGELQQGDVLKQNFSAVGDYMEGITVIPATYGAKAVGTLEVQILDKDGAVIQEKTIELSKFEDNQPYEIAFPKMIETGDSESYTAVFTCEALEGTSKLSFYYGNSIKLSRGEISKEYDSTNCLYLNDQDLDGELCLSVDGMNQIWFGNYYWPIMGGIGLFLVLLFMYVFKKHKAGKKAMVMEFLDSLHHYWFLIGQLVKRDFKTKYKRSVLGVCWSFLNPLLMMLVQYIVFSTIFSSGVANYPVYLLSGIVMFNFFNECCAMGISSITSNASLITKVYVPKYIYPLARVVSSLVNLGFSLIPLLIVTFVTGLWPRPAFILLPFPIICMMIFSLGMSYFLSTAMVFFKDTQFIWNVLSTVWLYATPIFYTENIITSSAILKIFHCNPMYQFIYFVRSILIDGVSPAPEHYLYCLLLSIVPFAIGFYFFKKNEDKFIFNL